MKIWAIPFVSFMLQMVFRFSPPSSSTQAYVNSLQLGSGLGLLHDGVQLGGLHDVALDLELARHEQALGVGLASDELAEVLLGKDEGDCCRKECVSLLNLTVVLHI